MKTVAEMPMTLVPELETPEARKALAEGVMALLFRWGLEDRDQLVLLGLSNPDDLERYRQGEPLPESKELLERVGHLFAIDRTFQKSFRSVPGFRDWWMRTAAPGLGYHSPLEVVRRRGLEGLRSVRQYLEASVRSKQ